MSEGKLVSIRRDATEVAAATQWLEEALLSAQDSGNPGTGVMIFVFDQKHEETRYGIFGEITASDQAYVGAVLTNRAVSGDV